MTADIDRQKLRELCERATPGPWNLGRGPKTLFVDGPSTNPSIPSPDIVCTSALSDRSIEQDNDNMRFIAASRTALPALLDLTDAQAAKIDDWYNGLRGSDIRLLIGDLKRARAALTAKIAELEEMIEASDAVTGDQDSALTDSYKYEEALRAQIAEQEVALAKAENILARNLGHQTEKCYDALEIIRDALFPGLKPILPTRIAELEAENARLSGELRLIDSVMARIPALDKKTRWENVEHAILTASRAEPAERDLELAMSRIAALESERDQLRKQMEGRADWMRRAQEVIRFYADAWTFKKNKLYGGLEYFPKDELLEDCGNRAGVFLSAASALEQKGQG